MGGRLAEPAYLPDKLQGGCLDLFTRRWCGPLAEDLYGTTHGGNGTAKDSVSIEQGGYAPVNRSAPGGLQGSVRPGKGSAAQKPAVS